jgi:hypothetical protein
MKLNSDLLTNTLTTQIYCERHVNDSKGRFSDYSEVNPIYDPQGSSPFVLVPYVDLDKSEVEIYQSNPSSELLAQVITDKARFFWHPDTVRKFKRHGFLKMQPTSSTRTLLTEDSENRFFVKTDLNKKHFRFNRRLRKASVIHSLKICEDLYNISSNEEVDVGLICGFLPESIGIVIASGEHKESGVLFRDSVAYPRINEGRLMIPYHSVYADDPNDCDSFPILIQLIQIHTESNPIVFFVEKIIGPIQDTWLFLLSKRGILPELHGQNTLMELDRNFNPTRLIYRDFQGTYSDSAIRRDLGLIPFIKHVVGEETGTTKESQYSNVFDNLIGKYLLARLVRVFCKYYPEYSYKYVCGLVTERFRGLKGNDLSVFPKTIFGFHQTAREQSSNEVILVDTGALPEFR